MPPLMREDSSESRNQSIGKKRARTQTNGRPRKRRRDFHEQQPQDLTLTDNNISTLSQRIDASKLSRKDSTTDTAPQSESTNEQANMSEATNPNFGRNRLATGYTRPQMSRQGSKSVGEISDIVRSTNIVGVSSGSPIEISDDEMESEGGMVINIDQDDQDDQEVKELSSDDATSQESGEVMSTPKNAHEDSVDLFVVDPTPSLPVKRLADLSPAELEDQLKYAFFYLDRDRVDLSRPVMCLGCTDEGHLNIDCKKLSREVFPVPKVDATTEVKLWISCCVCASKSHLVGDCPRVRSDQAARWSLKALSPEQVTNMSLESGFKKLEKEAENRDMRPQGLRIRGRAGIHNTGGPQDAGSTDDDNEPFLRKPVAKSQANGNADSARPQRYDRYDPPSGNQSHRGGGPWYATDSFGRRRSRSPDDRVDSYRPREDYGRSHAAPERDNWRPPPSNERREPPRGRAHSPPRNGRGPTATSGPPTSGPGANVKFSLPTRKGSNTWSQPGQSGSSTPTSNGKGGNNAQSKKKKGGRNRGRGTRNG